MPVRTEIVHCDNCGTQIKTSADWEAYDDADLCAKCYQNMKDEE